LPRATAAHERYGNQNYECAIAQHEAYAKWISK
jgi:hypothetical protein